MKILYVVALRATIITGLDIRLYIGEQKICSLKMAHFKDLSQKGILLYLSSS